MSRVLECLFPQFFFNLGDHLIVLGDVPLRTSTKQLLLVHQPHLQDPKVNEFVGRSAVFRAMRVIARFNSSFAECVIVQTEAMAAGLKKSYPDWQKRNCIKVIGQPPPNWFNLSDHQRSDKHESRGLRLFYPAAGYPHKNHSIFEGLYSLDIKNIIDRVIVTVPDKEGANSPAWLHYVGELSQEDCLLEYQRADALIYPSLLESYGLPLIEAMVMGLPIIVADLPYAHALCGEDAIYFDPKSNEALVEACVLLKKKMENGWYPDWSLTLAMMPKNWSVVAQEFLQEF
jgi:hypothetical protein